jgi:hypothetical protein
VTELCGLSLSSVGRYIRRYRATGSVSPDKFGGYKDYALAKYAARIKRWIAQQPDLTLLELQARLAKAGVKVAASSVFRFLHYLRFLFSSTSIIRRGSSDCDAGGWIMSSRPQPSEGPTGKARGARGCASVWHSPPPLS